MKNHAIRWDWTTAFLLIVATYFASSRLVTTNWTENLLTIQLLAILATVTGLALGTSRFPSWLAFVFTAAYGSFFIPWRLGLLVIQANEWNDKLQILSDRLLFTLGQVLQRDNVTDPILFLSMMSLVFWASASFAGYRLVRRGDAWGASLPMAVVIIVMQTYDPLISRRVWYVAAYLLFALLLVARQQLLRQRETWESKHIQIPLYIGADLLRAALGGALIVVLLAWVSPALASPVETAENLWDALTRPWRAFREDFSRAFYPLEGAAVSSSDYYSDTLPLGRGNALSQSIIFTVQVLESEQPVQRHYWRDRVYDTFEDGEWQSNFNQFQRVLPNEDKLIFPLLEGRQVASFRFTSGKRIHLLHTAPQPLWVSQIANLTYSPNMDGTFDLAALRAPNGVESGEVYEAEGWLTATSIEDLRAAGTTYPSWVTERYLQVPDEITQRTRDLAMEISQGQETPYDIAQAVTQYLRQSIDYQDNIPLAPSGAEPIDWFLFVQKQGFCNYYASAEVMLLRVLGIPARLAVGYSQGEQSSQNLLLESEFLGGEILEERLTGELFYTVRQRDAHAWPEVYFPGIGWVEFEPTGNQQELVRPISRDAILAQNSQATLAETPQEELAALTDEEQLAIAEELSAIEANSLQQRLFQGALFFGIVALFGVTVFWRQYRLRGGPTIPVLLERGLARLDIQPPEALRNWARLSQLSPLTRAYMQINESLRQLGLRPRPGHTSTQRISRLSKEIPRLQTELEQLGAQYQEKLFAATNAADEQQAKATAWKIRTATVQLRVRHVWRKLTEWNRSYNPMTRS
ncbi:MAG: transglutaminase-like domain-containing protein [Anaerolineales bacterium]